MNRQDIAVSRIFKGKWERDEHRFLVVTHARDVYMTNAVPKGHQAIGRQGFETALTDAFHEHIRSFARTAHNRNVYALSVYTDERHSFLLYLNTLEGFERTITESPYYCSYSEEQKHDLKYSLGDFAFSYATFQGPFASQYAAYHDAVKALSAAGGPDGLEPYKGSPDLVRYVYKAELFEGGQFLTALHVTKRLLAQSVWLLQTTPDFAAFASSGSEYIDYSVVMRQTIDTERFYRIFPEMKSCDEAFQAAVEEARGLPYGEQVTYWWECVRENRNRQPDALLTATVRTDYQAVEALADVGAPILPAVMQALRSSVQQGDQEKAAFLCEVLLESGGLSREVLGEMAAAVEYAPPGDQEIRSLLTRTRQKLTGRF
ncbi:DUF4303 domain-containing protein [Paenibacillus mucilaginosus]|uniref:Uncharacterized protein n=2 Tax=Paenibacillus mucilaginosus TaxID=61624 RepID=F8FQV5_PAEMK|nr:hypothetical protein KNP414_00695 [Paenibacillus mucilaginosus KNP414]WDM28285.1 DUF4303 domain-containing protein [Paenibacillus mucilaginosus]